MCLLIIPEHHRFLANRGIHPPELTQSFIITVWYVIPTNPRVSWIPLYFHKHQKLQTTICFPSSYGSAVSMTMTSFHDLVQGTTLHFPLGPVELEVLSIKFLWHLIFLQILHFFPAHTETEFSLETLLPQPSMQVVTFLLSSDHLGSVSEIGVLVLIVSYSPFPCLQPTASLTSLSHHLHIPSIDSTAKDIQNWTISNQFHLAHSVSSHHHLPPKLL